MRTKVDWALEGVAAAALVAALGFATYYWPRILDPRFAAILPAKTAIIAVMVIDLAAYAALTLGAHGIFAIPPELDRRSPQLRSMLFSTVIVMKAVLSLFCGYLVWALINAGLRRGGGPSGLFLTGFTLAVPIPLLIYTLRLRRYR